jgi:hypothetical protein
MTKTHEHKELEAGLKKVRSALGKLGKRHRAETKRLEDLHKRNLRTLETSTRADQLSLEKAEQRISARLSVLLGRAAK